MHRSNHGLGMILGGRSAAMRPGVRRWARKVCVRSERRRGARMLERDLGEREPKFDRPLYYDPPAMVQPCADLDWIDDEEADQSLAEQLDEDALSRHLEGSLPDFMLDQIQQAQGSAFDLLSLFECRRVSPIARIDLED